MTVPVTSVSLLKVLGDDAQSPRWTEFANRYASMIDGFLYRYFPTVDAEEVVNEKYDTLKEVAAWIESDTTASAELITRISTIEQNYLDGADKEELQGEIDALSTYVGDLPEDAASETVVLPQDIYDILKRYSLSGKIFTIFDTDAVGIKSAKQLQEQFGTIPIYFTSNYKSKDPSDMVKDYSYKKVLTHFDSVLKQIYYGD
jgi:hypothetical protein